MSDFHDALRRAAQQHGEAVVPGLTADAVVAASVDGISRGRRRRSAAQAGASVLGVAVIGVAGWLSAPLLGEQEVGPAGPEQAVNAGPWRYDVVPGEDVNEGDPQVMLRGESTVMCSDELDLTPGVTVHDPDAFDRAIWLEAGLFLPHYGDYEQEEVLAVQYYPHWTIAAGGEIVATSTVSLLMESGTVVGQSPGSSLSGATGELIEGPAGAPIPRVGECEDSELSVEEFWSLESGDPLNSLLVVQWWSGSEPGEGALLATIVVDPNEPANSTEPPPVPEPSSEPEPSVSELPNLEPSASPEPVARATLRAPEGDEYQAFVVQRPQPGCSPLADLRDAGHPGVDDSEYTVELPGATESLTHELWARGTVATLPDGDDPWYLGVDAWIVSAEFWGGKQDPHLEWTSLSVGGWALSSGGYDPLQGDDCAYIEPMPTIGGAVFLVIDGVEGEVDPGFTPEVQQTWVYLGEAE